MRKRRIKILLVIFAPIFVLLFFLLFERIRGQLALARYKHELIAKGEKLTARDLIVSIPKGENGAREVFDAAPHLEKGVVLPDRCPPRMKLLHSGRAIVGFRENEWVDAKVTNHWDQLAADLETNEKTLAQIRIALEKPALNNKLDYSQGMKMQFQHLSPAKSLTYWFGGSSQLALHDGNTHGALDDLLAQVRLPRLLAEDHILISELVRIAIAAVAKSATWEALQADGWTDEDLASLQKAWETQNFATAMARSLEGERIFGDVSYEMMRSSNQDTIDALFGLEEVFPVDDSDRPAWERLTTGNLPFGDEIAGFFKKQLYCRIWRYIWSHQDQRRFLETMQRLIEITRAAAKEKSFSAAQAAVTQLEEESLDKNLYDRLRYPNPQSIFTMSRFVNKVMKAETERAITICAIALKRYSIRHGELPTSLDSLVPEFVPSVPMDYMDGKPMKYHLSRDGSVALYSVGEDGKDDGGDASLLPDKTSYGNLWNRKDFIWPSPALREEVEEGVSPAH